MRAVAGVGIAAENAGMSSGACDFIVDVTPRADFFVTERTIAIERRLVAWQWCFGARVGRVGRGVLLLRDGGLQPQRRTGTA